MTLGAVRLTSRLYLVTRQGTILDDLSDLVLSGQVTYDESRPVPMTLDLQLRDPDAVRSLGDYVMPELSLAYADGATVSGPVGVYAVVRPKVEALPARVTGRIEGRDLTWVVARDSVAAPYTVSAGTDPAGAAASIVSAMGLRVAIPASGTALPSPLSWPSGTSKLRIVNDLLTAAGYYALGMRRDGTLWSGPWRRLASAEPAVTYRAPDPAARVKVLAQPVVRTAKVEDIANRIVVRKESGQTAIVAVVTNDDPRSPVSTVRLGLVLTREVSGEVVNTIVDQATANALAVRLLEEAAAQYTTLELVTSPDLRETREIYALDIRDASGRVVADGRWWCDGWQVGFTAKDGMMKHTCHRLESYGG